MFIYFDRNGVLQEVINDKAARLGDLNANEIYVYVDEVELDDIWLTLKRPDGTLSVEKSFIANKVVREIPYDPKRDMKFFKDYKEYEFYKFTISDEITIAGVYQATIRMTYEDTLSALGVLVFKAETGVIKSDQNITQAQYDYLIWYVGSWQGQIGDLEDAMGIAQADILGLKNRMNVAEQDINKIEDGTTVVNKALKDDLGNTIKSTYANKLDLVYSSSNNRIAITLKSYDGNSIDADLIDLPKATTSADGLLAKEDKEYLNTIPTQLSNKADLVGGKVPASQLPAYVDDVLEFDTFDDFPEVGQSDAIYIAKDTNKTYRWTGASYVIVGSDLALGETPSTAYRGDRGKIAYDHSQIVSGNPHNTTKAMIGLGNVDNTSDLNKPISTATQNALNKKADGYAIFNIIKNGNFANSSNGLATGWFFDYPSYISSYRVYGNEQYWTASTVSVNTRIASPSISVNAGDKLFIKYYNDGAGHVYLHNEVVFNAPSNGVNYKIYEVVGTYANKHLRFRNQTANVECGIKDVIVVNLTAIWGAGNEPTLNQILEYCGNDYFDIKDLYTLKDAYYDKVENEKKSYAVNNRFLELEDGNIFLKNESYYTFGKIAPNQNISGWGNRKWMQKCKRTPKYIKVIGGTYINPKFSHGVVSVVEYDKDFNFLKTRRVFTETSYLLLQNTAYIKFDIACYEPQDELNAFEYGTLNTSNGQPEDSTTRIRTPMADVDDFEKILIKVGGVSVTLHFYDASQNWLGYAVINSSATQFPATVSELYALSNGNQSSTPKYVRAVVLPSGSIVPAPNDDPTCFAFVDDMDDMSLVSVELSLLSPTEELYEIKNERWGSGKYGFVFSYYPQFGFNEIASPSGTEEQFIPAKSIMYKSGWLMLPKNYSQTGKPVKLIFFAHGSGDFGGFHGEPFGTYTEYIEYLRDEGYAIFDCYDFEFYYDDPYTTNNKGTNYGSPSTLAGIVDCYQWVLRNYNVDDSGLFVTAKSAGGYKSTPFLWNKGLPVKAMGLLAPVIWGASSSNFGGYRDDARRYFFTDYGFSSADITTMLTGTTEEKKATLKNNWKKFVGYANELSGLVSDDDAEDVFENYVDHSGFATEIYKRNCVIPLKIWVAVDDLYVEGNILLSQIQRGAGLAYMRAFPADSGGHHAVDNSPLAPKVASITTKLGITHTDVPLAYVELITWFRRF